eukprot:9299188-Heterocapsa_arctica.AAC.1
MGERHSTERQRLDGDADDRHGLDLHQDLRPQEDTGRGRQTAVPVGRDVRRLRQPQRLLLRWQGGYVARAPLRHRVARDRCADGSH